MSLFREISDLDGRRGCVAAIGNFDGVHRGHQAMLAKLRRQADAAGLPALAITFDPPPVELLKPEAAPPRLMRFEQKAAYLEQAGADAVLALPTDRRLLNLTPEEFFYEMLLGRLGVRGMVEGPNFRFGRGRTGDVELLRRLCEKTQVPLSVVEPVYVGDRLVSSSLVRRLVTDGDLRAAAEMLGRPHEAVGVVEHGANRGGRLGFPTANLAGIATLLPPDGVYAGRAEVDRRRYAAAVHIGPNTTFGETERKFEAHLLDFSGDLYGRTLRVELIELVRPTARFDSTETLVEQLRSDCRRVRALVATPTAGG